MKRTPRAPELQPWQTYLEHSRVCKDSDAFFVTPFEAGVTLYSQQVRALNLIYALREFTPGNGGKRLLNESTHLAVVGGGAAGLTAAAAAATLGSEVSLFEQQQVLMPFQRGCETRWVHPHYYDWPQRGADNPFAKLPILDWRAGTAGQVAEQIISEFHTISENSKSKVHRFLGITHWKWSKENGRRFRISLVHNSGEAKDDILVNIVIFATGFGVERPRDKSLSKLRTFEYWRNDNLSRTNLGQHALPLPYLVSGTGDGGLVDAIRLRISSFKHERIFLELFEDLDPHIISELCKIHAEAATPVAAEGGWLYRCLSRIAGDDLEKGPFKDVAGRLRRRLRSDTRVFVNAQDANFPETLDLRKTSLANALLCFLLYRLNQLQYVGGTLQSKKLKPYWTINASEEGTAPAASPIPPSDAPPSDLAWN